MVEVVYKGQLGNNLFQYCLGRILAEDLGFALAAEPIRGFPHTADAVEGARYESPTVVLSGQHAELARLRAQPPQCRILLNGWFQRHEHYRPHREKIRRWLAFGEAVRAPSTPPDTVVHVRRTDYVSNGWALPFSFYEEALTRLSPAGQVWILTDDPTDPFFRRFARWQPRFSSGTALEDLRFMSAAKRIVMSQSTFSWWATFLGDPDEVVCPDPSFGAWSQSGEDAALIERDRFICVRCDEPYTPSTRESWYQRRRAVRPAIARTVRRWLPVPPLRRSV